ncbi:MAG: CHAD domain-containing protein [Nevskia sp.]|nr:CHAD domain-containing protein [Nevskia sp.]
MTDPASITSNQDGGPVALYRLAPERAARRLLSRQLKQAEAAGQRLAAGEDPEALHDFRVALRRFRSLERAHRTWLGDAMPKKLRKRLKLLVHSTGPARDSEVQLEWLDAQRAALRPNQRPGHHWLRCRLEERQRRGYTEVRSCLASEFIGLSLALRRALAVPAQTSPMSFARVSGEQLKPLLKELRGEFAAVSGEDGVQHIHAARLLVKRARYLLEPVAAAFDGGEALVRELGRLQDQLGSIHDAEVLGQSLVEAAEAAGAMRYHSLVTRALGHDLEEFGPVARRRGDERAGLTALAQRVQAEFQQTRARLHADIRAGRVEDLLLRVDAAVEALAPADEPAESAAQHAFE